MRIVQLFACSVLVAGGVFAATLPSNEVKGEYMEARTADIYTGPCFANSEVNLEGQLAVMGWRIEKGTFQGVNLDGLGVVGVLKASNTLGDVFTEYYPVHSILIIDEKANPEQRMALKNFAQKVGGDLFSDVVKVEYAPVTMDFAGNNLHTMRGTLKAGALAKIETRAINEGDHICSNEEVWYNPLVKVDHAMPAVTLAHEFTGTGLNERWSSPGKRSAFVASFHYND